MNNEPTLGETLRNTAWLAVILLLVAVATGCGQSVGNYEEGPLSTWTFRQEMEKADIQRWHCWEDADDQDQWCRDNPQPDVDCTAQYTLDTHWCSYWYMRKVNKVPLRECGVAVYIINGVPDDPNYSSDRNMEDEDGDGLKTFWEAWLGYNPCHKYSFGNNFPMDGSDDFDADGYLDRDDEYPICNGSFVGDPDALPDPGDYPSDCV